MISAFERTRPLRLLAGACLAGCAGSGPDLADGEALQRTAQALEAPAYGWLRSPPFSPSASFNSSGGGVRVVNLDTGRYSVRFEGLGAGGGNLQVSAFGAGNARCKLGGEALVEGHLDVLVLCHAPDGAPQNAAFSLGYAKGGEAGAYLRAQAPRAASYKPEAAHAYDPGGLGSHVTRLARGEYAVRLRGAAASSAEGGNVLVTAIGSDAAHCKVGAWFPWGADLLVHVLCFDATGARADSVYSLSYVDGSVPAPHGVGAYAWADQPSAPAYTPSPYYADSAAERLPGAAPEAAAAQAGRTDTGVYSLHFPRQTLAAPWASFVTAHGRDGAYCKLSSVAEADVLLGVRCFDASGQPADSTAELAEPADPVLSSR